MRKVMAVVVGGLMAAILVTAPAAVAGTRGGVRSGPAKPVIMDLPGIIGTTYGGDGPANFPRSSRFDRGFVSPY
jgi:hypothetical protein